MRIIALDLIRFLSALSVVLYHYIFRPESNAYPILKEVAMYGYLGVPVFFIISGYVIALSASNRSALQFGISRFVRLYPALWVSVLFTVIILFFFADKEINIMQIIANFTLLNEYFGFNDIDGVYWTLKVELKFYFCIFILIIFDLFKKYHIWLSLWVRGDDNTFNISPAFFYGMVYQSWILFIFYFRDHILPYTKKWNK